MGSHHNTATITPRCVQSTHFPGIKIPQGEGKNLYFFLIIIDLQTGSPLYLSHLRKKGGNGGG